ncbi:hypothetical protein N9L47_02965 [Rhodobacteraceae bacterium]|nr:hypothetical protein [Paracoccaceae bacterium]
MRLFTAMALLLLPMPVMGQEFAHCYVGEPPEDAKISEESNPLDGFGNTFGVAAIRHACGKNTDADKVMLQARLEGAMCTDTSEVSTRTVEMMTAESSTLAANYQTQLGMDEAGFETFCAALEPCEPVEGTGFTPACFEAIETALGN